MRENSEFNAPSQINSWRTAALGIGGVLSLVILVVALIFPEYREQALRSWLLGFIFWAGIGIGCIGVLMLQYLTGGAWGVVIRRTLEAGTRTLPIISFYLFRSLSAQRSEHIRNGRIFRQTTTLSNGAVHI